MGIFIVVEETFLLFQVYLTQSGQLYLRDLVLLSLQSNTHSTVRFRTKVFVESIAVLAKYWVLVYFDPGVSGDDLAMLRRRARKEVQGECACFLCVICIL